MHICETCGKPIHCGEGCMQDGDGFFHTHEGECFEKYMDKTYGKGRWMQIGANAAVGDGGFYLVTDDENRSGFDDPNIFWTTYEYGDDPVFCDDITGWLGAVLDSDTSDIPKEVMKHLQSAYDICVNEQEKYSFYNDAEEAFQQLELDHDSDSVKGMNMVATCMLHPVFNDIINKCRSGVIQPIKDIDIAENICMSTLIYFGTYINNPGHPTEQALAQKAKDAASVLKAFRPEEDWSWFSEKFGI